MLAPMQYVHPNDKAQTLSQDLDIFFAVQPGLEELLLQEVLSSRFKGGKTVPGGVMTKGSWADAWRANLVLRGASRVMVRLATFPANHLAQLDRLSREIPWGELLHEQSIVRVDASCRRSKIYHSGAAEQRVAKTIKIQTDATISKDADISVFVRIENNICTISIDTSGELLHRRGFKQAVVKAPMRENMAALFLRACGFDGTTTVLDPMCGSGTFILEAAEMAAGLLPGRERHFAFEQLKTFDAELWQEVKSKTISAARKDCDLKFHGSDRDQKAIEACKANAERADVTGLVSFSQSPASQVKCPDGAPGLIIVNPPYGARLGDQKALKDLYRAFGQTVRERFAGWRVGLVTSEKSLAQATGLRFEDVSAPIPHGSLRIQLFQTTL